MKIKKYFLLMFCVYVTHQIFSQTPQLNWAIKAGSNGFDGGNAITVDALGNTYSTGTFSGTVDFDPGAGIYNLTSNGGSDIYVLKTDANGNFVWAKKMGSGGAENGSSIVTSPSGFVYVTGFFSNTVDFDPGPGTFYITSLDGSCNSEIFILKLDASGNFVWAKSVEGLETICTSFTDVGWDLKIDNNENIYITGQFQGHADFNTSTLPADTFYMDADGTNATADIFILKLNSSGNFKWAKRIGNGLSDAGYGINVSQAGNLYITGLYTAPADFDPGPGVDILSNFGGVDCFILKLDTAGNYVWAKGIGGSQDERGNSITTDAQENIYITGHFTGTVDFDPSASSVKNLVSPSGARGIFVLKLNASGNYTWAKACVGTIAGGGERSGSDIALDNQKNIFVTGHFTEKFDFNPSTLPADTFYLYANGAWTNTDAFILKLDSMGSFNWAGSMGNTGVDRGMSVYIDQNNNIYTTGYFAGVVDFDPNAGVNNLTGSGSGDMYIQKFSQSSVTSINDIYIANYISVYPNPTKDNIYVYLKNIQGNSIVISIYDVIGRKLIEHEIFETEEKKTYTIGINSLSVGIYILHLNIEGKIYSHKIIKD